MIDTSSIGTSVSRLNEYLGWSDRRLLAVLKKLSDEEFQREFAPLAGSIHHKTAHIVSIYVFFQSILEGNPLEQFPDLSHLNRLELIDRWEGIIEQWPNLWGSNQDKLLPLPLAGNQRVEAREVFVDALLHTVHHRGQILTMVRLLGKDKEAVHPRDTNLDYLMFLLKQHPEAIYPANN